MPFQLLSFPFDGQINNSLQVGDIAYWVSTTTPGTAVGSYAVGALQNVIRIGEVMSFTSSSIGVTTTEQAITVTSTSVPPVPQLNKLTLAAVNTGIEIGMVVLGPNIITGTTVQNVSGTTVTLSQDAGAQIIPDPLTAVWPQITFAPSAVDVYHNMAYAAPTSTTDFLMFAKDKRANTTSLVGYYAEVKLVNDSHEKIELFSVNSEIHESSK